MCRQDRLLPCKCGFMRLSDFRGRSLAAMAHGATPIARIVRNWGMSAKWLRHGIVDQAGLRHALVASRAAIDDVDPWQPDLINIRIVVRQEFLGVRPSLREFHERAFVFLPFRPKVLYRRNRKNQNKNHRGHRECQPHAVRQFTHVFSRHVSPKATPRTSPGLERMSRQRSNTAPWL